MALLRCGGHNKAHGRKKFLPEHFAGSERREKGGAHGCLVVVFDSDVPGTAGSPDEAHTPVGLHPIGPHRNSA